MILRRSLLIFFVLIILDGCGLGDNDEGLHVYTSTFYFDKSQYDWTGGFADYKIADSLDSELHFEYTDLPANLATNQKALMLSGKNVGGSLSMFIKTKIEGLSPNTKYTLVYDVIFASNAPVGTIGGDSVKLVTAAFHDEPIVAQKEGYYKLLTNQGSDINDFDFSEIGSIGNSSSAQDYYYVNRGSDTSAYPYITGTTNSHGELWLYVGTQSEYMGVTTIYFTYISVLFSASS